METLEQARAELRRLAATRMEVVNKMSPAQRKALTQLTPAQLKTIKAGHPLDVLLVPVTDPQTGETYAYPDKEVYGEELAEKIAESISTPAK